MNAVRASNALARLRQSVAELYPFVAAHLPDFEFSWRRVLSNLAIGTEPLSREDAQQIVLMVRDAFGNGLDGSFLDTGPWRDDEAERFALNRQSEELRDRVRSALAELETSIHEGEVNMLAVRRHLTNAESILLEADQADLARRLRLLLSSDVLEPAAAAVMVRELRSQVVSSAVSDRLETVLDAIEAELQ